MSISSVKVPVLVEEEIVTARVVFVLAGFFRIGVVQVVGCVYFLTEREVVQVAERFFLIKLQKKMTKS